MFNGNNIVLFFLVALTVIFTGCATRLSPTAKTVRVTSQIEIIEKCIYLGQVNASSIWGGYALTGLGFESAMNELKNKVAEMGGNVLLTQIVSNTLGGTRMIGDAYKCKDETETARTISGAFQPFQ